MSTSFYSLAKIVWPVQSIMFELTRSSYITICIVRGAFFTSKTIRSQAEVGGEVVKMMVENGKPVVPGQVCRGEGVQGEGLGLH